MSKNNWTAVVFAVLAAAVAALGQEMAAGRLPLPAWLHPLVPVVVAMIAALTPALRREAGEES